MSVLTRMLRFIAVRIVIERSSSFRLCIGERRYLDARHHYQYPQHTDERLLAISPSYHPNVVRVSFDSQTITCQ